MKLTVPLTATSFVQVKVGLDNIYTTLGHSRLTGTLAGFTDGAKTSLNLLSLSQNCNKGPLIEIADEEIKKLFQPQVMTVTDTGIELEHSLIKDNPVARDLGILFKMLDNLFVSSQSFFTSELPATVQKHTDKIKEGLKSIRSDLTSFLSDIISNPLMSELISNVEALSNRFASITKHLD